MFGSEQDTRIWSKGNNATFREEKHFVLRQVSHAEHYAN